MKSAVFKGIAVFIFFGIFVFSGCASKPELYEFEQEGLSATISFKTGNPSVRFVSYDGKLLPGPEKGTYWDPISFTAGRPLRITVHAYYEHQSNVRVRGGILGLVSDVANIAGTLTRGVDTDLVFNCPALTAGSKYELSFEKGIGMPGKNTLKLIDLDTKKAIYEQEFEVKQEEGNN